MSLWCGGSEFELVAEKARVKQQLEALPTEEVGESGCSTPTPPHNTPKQGSGEEKTNIKESLRRVTLAFSPSTSEILDLTEAINMEDQEDEEEDEEERREREERMDIQRMLFQSPHFMRSRQRMLEDETTSMSSIPEDLTSHGQFSPMSRQMQLCSPYSDMTSVKSEMLTAERVGVDRFTVDAAQATIKENFKLDRDAMLAASHGDSHPNSEETTNEPSEATTSQRADKINLHREPDRTTSSSSLMSSITGSSALSEYHSTTSSDLKVRPGKKYTFRRRVGKAASFIMRAGKKRDKIGSDTHSTSAPTPETATEAALPLSR